MSNVARDTRSVFSEKGLRARNTSAKGPSGFDGLVESVQEVLEDDQVLAGRYADTELFIGIARTFCWCVILDG